MQVCPNCSHRNRPGVVFCENCGTSLIGDSPISTKYLGSKDSADSLANAAAIVAKVSSDIFGKGTILRIEIAGTEPVLLKPKEETVFGRRDPLTGAMPDVDLTSFAGYRMGVSRRHAIIKQTEDYRLELFDLGSSNGTFLNGVRLSSHKPYVLHDGDEIRFGQMALRVYFQVSPPENPS
jgi:pSer/pThr/pTyr-binding forkhead associated (FHA) protein